MPAWKHWPPRRGEELRQGERVGKITYVDKDEEEVLVCFPARVVTHVTDVFEWKGHTITLMHWRVNGQRLSLREAELMPEWLKPVTRVVDTYTFDDLRGNWSSSDGGEEAWLL